MKRLYIFLTLAVLSAGSCLYGQSTQAHPQRTPEEIALKQTEMLVRELHITDSVQRDTIYRLHLKYARLRAVSNTRAENLERLQQITEDLRHILTKDQFERFMSRQVDSSPRHPHQPVGRLPQTHEDYNRTFHSTSAPTHEEGKTRHTL